MSDKTLFVTRPGLDDPTLVKALDYWLRLRWADELEDGEKKWVGKHVAVGPLRYTAFVLGLRILLDDDQVFRLAVKADANGEETIIPTSEARLIEVVAVRADKVRTNNLVGAFVRVVNGVRLGHYLAIGFVQSHDVDNDLVTVKMALDGKVIPGFKSSDLKVVLE